MVCVRCKEKMREALHTSRSGLFSRDRTTAGYATTKEGQQQSLAMASLPLNLVTTQGITTMQFFLNSGTSTIDSVLPPPGGTKKFWWVGAKQRETHRHKIENSAMVQESCVVRQ